MQMSALPVRIFSFLCLLVLPLAVYAPKGEVILLGLGSLALLLMAARQKQLIGLFRTPLAILLVLTLFWAAASAFWALQMRDTWDAWTSITLLFVAIVVTIGMTRNLATAERRQIGQWAVWGLWATLALLIMELTLDMPLARILRSYPGGLPYVPQTIFNASLGMVAILVWPSVVWLWREQKYLPAALTLAAAFVAVYLGEGDSAKLALVVTSLVFPLILLAGRRGITVLMVLVTVGVLVAPVLPLTIISTAQIEQRFPDLKQSALHRIKVWEFTATNIADKPFTGWGLDSSRNIPGGNKIIVNAETYMPLHPHNGVLQTWLELGAPGATLLAALILLCLFGLYPLKAINRAGAAAALAGALTIYCLSFGIWQSWWVAALALMGLITMLQTDPQADDEES
jgi:exopolysaccharide production protein ExoQ